MKKENLLMAAQLRT